MPDIDPAALSRPAVSLSTPILSSKTLAGSLSSSQKPTKSNQLVPARIDLEPLYTELKSAIGAEQWLAYKEATAEFLIGRLNQIEYSKRIDPILTSSTGDKDHLHNQLIAAIYGNITREIPDQGLAPWVSANDKPSAAAGSKPVSGDATERRLKGDVMQLPARDRRRIKDLVQNDYDPYESLSSTFVDPRRRATATADIPTSAAGGINNMNFDLEIRKRFTQPLAVESGEFPDVGLISGRMLPFCYEAGLASGHASEAPQLVTFATESFIKEILTQIFGRTRSNAPGDSASAGYGIGTTWVQTHKYKRQLHLEEDAAHRGELTRDKNGLLPIEAKAASERGVLGMADVRIALEMADTGMSQFPTITRQILCGYREGELENWDDYTWFGDQQPTAIADELNSALVNGETAGETANGGTFEPMDLDQDGLWEGADGVDMDMLDGMLDSCLAVGS